MIVTFSFDTDKEDGKYQDFAQAAERSLVLWQLHAEMEEDMRQGGRMVTADWIARFKALLVEGGVSL